MWNTLHGDNKLNNLFWNLWKRKWLQIQDIEYVGLKTQIDVDIHPILNLFIFLSVDCMFKEGGEISPKALVSYNLFQALCWVKFNLNMYTCSFALIIMITLIDNESQTSQSHDIMDASPQDWFDRRFKNLGIQICSDLKVVLVGVKSQSLSANLHYSSLLPQTLNLLSRTTDLL